MKRRLTLARHYMGRTLSRTLSRCNLPEMSDSPLDSTVAPAEADLSRAEAGVQTEDQSPLLVRRRPEGIYGTVGRSLATAEALDRERQAAVAGGAAVVGTAAAVQGVCVCASDSDAAAPVVCERCRPAGGGATAAERPDTAAPAADRQPAEAEAAERRAAEMEAADAAGKKESRIRRTLRALRQARARVSRVRGGREPAAPATLRGSSPALSTGSEPRPPIIDLTRFNPDQYPTDDFDERARQERAREIAEGIEVAPAGSRPTSAAIASAAPDLTVARLQVEQQPAALPHAESQLLVSHFAQLAKDGSLVQRTVHTTVDYIHCLVPDLLSIVNSPFYWGEMDRYEAERLLDNKPEGTFLLRDSAQEEYLFSVSFRRYNRSLHARIEQWNQNFSFDSHDPGVYASSTVTGLIEHYKDPSCCMFFEPMLTRPLNRTFVFPLTHLCRAAVAACTSYDGINQLRLPKPLRQFLMEYHYKQRVRVRRFELPD